MLVLLLIKKQLETAWDTVNHIVVVFVVWCKAKLDDCVFTIPLQQWPIAKQAGVVMPLLL